MLNEKWGVIPSIYLWTKKPNVLSRNLLSKTVQKQYDNLHKAQKRRVNPPKKNAQILREWDSKIYPTQLKIKDHEYEL